MLRINFILWIIIGLITAVTVWMVSLYNNMIKCRNHVEDGWSRIDAQLKRRHSLIPNLVNTVKEYASHDKEVIKSITRLCNVSRNSTDSSANQEQLVSNALSGLMLQIETYPDLKADATFRNLQKQLSDIESEIQYTKNNFNEIVRKYNTVIQSFPAALIAQKFGFYEAEFYELDNNDA